MPRNTHPSRRGFLKIGGLSLGGLSLTELLRAEARAGIRSSPKSVIFVYLVGGPPHQDMFDLKPKAPAEVAGPWRPIATNVSGIEICEAFPRIAKMMDKFTIIRSLVGNQADHDAVQVFNGRDPRTARPSGGWPQIGSVVAKLQGQCRAGGARLHQPLLPLYASALQRTRARLPGHVAFSVSPDRPWP